jgi:hypothetical protein
MGQIVNIRLPPERCRAVRGVVSFRQSFPLHLGVHVTKVQKMPLSKLLILEDNLCFLLEG